MSDDTGGTTIRFTGKKCCLLDFASAKEAVESGSLEPIKDYGRFGRSADGKAIMLYTWDDGHRMLQRCKKCGAWFLVQRSEYHSEHDDYYTDWFQVDDENAAELINRTWNGFGIERYYDAPAIFQTNGVYRFRGVGAE